MTLSSYFIGISAGQLLYGPLLDRFGRKKPLFIGLLHTSFIRLCFRNRYR
jgi:DHA1 family bicyclomycin/chloramphenicol resistance-like MFS transporter